VNCQETLNLVHAYHDGELDAANTLQVERHFADCPQCFAVLRNLGALRSLVRSEELRYAAPSSLTRSIRSLAGEARRSERRLVWTKKPRVWLSAFAGLGVAVIALQLALLVRPDQEEEHLVGELTSSHIRSLMVNHLTDVTSTDQHTVKPWFDGKLDFAPPIKELREAGFPLLGGRLEYLANRSVAAIVYGRQKHFINLYIWPSASSSIPGIAEQNGYHLVHWISDGMTCWAVSDLNQQELKKFAERWREEPAMGRIGG
jgi:anti-sigma factor RsiW